MTLNQIRTILAERGIMLTKSLGQNFLHDANQLRKIADLGELHETDRVLEIGPGLGPLTEILLTRAGRVLGIEKDNRLATFLSEHFAEQIRAGRLELLAADALKYLQEITTDWSDWKLVSNLPYSVASPILVELAQSAQPPERLVATLQLEVAQRLAAKEGTPDYGLLTVLVGAHFEPAGMFRIPASCFFPPPDVDSGCVRLLRRRTPLLNAAEHRTYERVVKRSFSQRRKMMFKLLRSDWQEDLLRTGLERAGIASGERAEKVSIEQFAILSRCLHHGGRSSEEIFDVVNDGDEVIGKETRSEVHRLGLRHRAVHILVFNSAGQVFLQKRSQYKDHHPLAWDSSASGHVDAGEDYDASALREIGEELGIAPTSPPARLFKLPASAQTDQEHVWVYRLDYEGPFKLDPHEIERGGWFTRDEINSWLATRPEEFAPAFRHLWTRLHAPS